MGKQTKEMHAPQQHTTATQTTTHTKAQHQQEHAQQTTARHKDAQPRKETTAQTQTPQSTPMLLKHVTASTTTAMGKQTKGARFQIIPLLSGAQPLICSVIRN